MNSPKAYIASPALDRWLILAPPFIICAVLFLLPDATVLDEVSPFWWLALVVCIDVAHVYSTLFYTYFHSVNAAKHRTALFVIPAACLAVAMLLYSMGAMVFWSALAYLAVFHFIRQQYGFMRLYARNEHTSLWKRRSEAIIIYSATLYPIAYWHLGSPRTFHWFVDNDFFYFGEHPQWLFFISLLYIATLLLWVGTMVYEWRTRTFNTPKHFLIAGTYLSWYMGIVYFNGDLAFTALNVICHGIPYMALIWFTKKRAPSNSPLITWKKWALPLFILSIVGLALAEEFLWDVLHWRDHPELFAWAYDVPAILARDWQSLAIPLLALPQMTHYVLDGFIWKVRSMKMEEH